MASYNISYNIEVKCPHTPGGSTNIKLGPGTMQLADNHPDADTLRVAAALAGTNLCDCLKYDWTRPGIWKIVVQKYSLKKWKPRRIPYSSILVMENLQRLRPRIGVISNTDICQRWNHLVGASALLVSSNIRRGSFPLVARLLATPRGPRLSQAALIVISERRHAVCWLGEGKHINTTWRNTMHCTHPLGDKLRGREPAPLVRRHRFFEDTRVAWEKHSGGNEAF